jgi:hypothetical protein
VQGNNAPELLRAADVAVVRNLRGDSELASTLGAAFEQIPTHGNATVYARRH